MAGAGDEMDVVYVALRAMPPGGVTWLPMSYFEE
jgi:hypothetical protein